METTLKIDKEYLEVLKDLLKDSDIKTQKDYVHSMLLYFKETGINPSAKTKSIADELSKLRNTVVSFIRQQEKTKLDPIIEKFNETFLFMRDYFQNEAVSKKDLQDLISKISTSKVEKPQKIEIKSIDDEKQRNYNNHAKSMFREFSKHFKSSAFGSTYTIEKSVFERYKSDFEKL